MSTMDKIQELKASRSAVESGAKAARGRIASLLDPQSFVEIGAYVKSRSTDYNMQAQDTPADGVVTGYGTIEDRLVYVYSQDASVLGGAVGEMHAAKIAALYQKAVEMGAPVIGMIDSQGLRLQELTDALAGYGLKLELDLIPDDQYQVVCQTRLATGLDGNRRYGCGRRRRNSRTV